MGLPYPRVLGNHRKDCPLLLAVALFGSLVVLSPPLAVGWQRFVVGLQSPLQPTLPLLPRIAVVVHLEEEDGPQSPLQPTLPLLPRIAVVVHLEEDEWVFVMHKSLPTALFSPFSLLLSRQIG